MTAPYRHSDLDIVWSMARPLFAAPVAVAATDPRAQHEAPWHAETAGIARALDRRRQEFAAGRAAARSAMVQLGVTPKAIPTGTDRAPIWPDGLCGSISHCATACVAAVALGSDAVSLGIDVETITPQSDADLKIICTGPERAWLLKQPAGLRAQLATLVFSAKESAYKCQYPVTRTLLGFEDLCIDVDLDSATFTATFQRPVVEFGAGHRLAGRFATGAGLVLTGVALVPLDLPKATVGGAR